MSEMSKALADALARDKWPAVVVYDPEMGPGDDPGTGRVFLPEIDPMPEEGTLDRMENSTRCDPREDGNE